MSSEKQRVLMRRKHGPQLRLEQWNASCRINSFMLRVGADVPVTRGPSGVPDNRSNTVPWHVTHCASRVVQFHVSRRRGACPRRCRFCVCGVLPMDTRRRASPPARVPGPACLSSAGACAVPEPSDFRYVSTARQSCIRSVPALPNGYEMNMQQDSKQQMESNSGRPRRTIAKRVVERGQRLRNRAGVLIGVSLGLVALLSALE